MKIAAPASKAGLSRILQIIGLVGMLAVAAALQACSAVKLAYNQAPELGYWYLDAYFDFTGAQSLQVKAELARLQAWHRQTQLPAYVESLQNLQQQMAADMSPGAACALYADVRQKVVAISDHAEPAIAAFVGTLNASQLTHIQRKFDKNNDSFRDDYIDGTPRELQKTRQKKIVKRLEMLYGDLHKDQISLIAQHVAQSQFDARLSHAEMLRRQSDVLQTLRPLLGGQTAAPTSRVAMRGLIERTLQSPNPAYRSYQEKLVLEGCTLFANLHNSMTLAQRGKAMQHLNKYIRDFETLKALKT